MDNGYRGCGPHGVLGYRRYGVQGYGHMGQYGIGILGYRTYGPHGQWVQGMRPLNLTLTPSQWWVEMVQVMCQNVEKMSHCQKDVKLSKRCQISKSQTCRLWRRFTKKNKLTQWGSQILTSILTSQMMVTKNPQNVYRQYFWAILMTFIFDIKIDVNMCEPHYVNLFFLWTSSIVQMFDYLTFDIFLTTWHLFDILGANHPWAPLPICPYPCTPLPMYPIAHVTHCRCGP